MGVDPYKPDNIDSIVCKSITYYEMTSNKFLIENFNVLNDTDIAFIDGLHEYKQVYLECMCLMKCMPIGGTILIHDCNPFSEEMATPLAELLKYDRAREPWMGDVWKAIVLLRHIYPEMNIFVADTDCGIGVIRKSQEFIEKKIPAKIDEKIASMTYAYLDKNRNNLLNLKSISETMVEI